MRKQYHFWPGDEDLDAWDVDRLIRLGRDLPVHEIELASISEVDTVYWFDDASGPATVRSIVDHVRLIQEVDLAHPNILGHDGRVMDGMHRIARSLLEGRKRIRAVQFREPVEPDYRDCRPQDLPYD